MPTGRAHRVLHPTVVASLDAHLAAGGGKGLARAERMTPDEIVDLVTASGLRGRGGAGFPVGRKWLTVARQARRSGPPTIVVNAAEGEPGTFKDRSIVRRNPYLVVEGALIAARALGASRVVVATKASFRREVARLTQAVAEMQAAGLVPRGISIRVHEGPDAYLYGEESALLESVCGREPFPRVVPTYRVGLTRRPRAGDRHRRDGTTPALVNNLESIANLPKLVARGVRWFRSVGTDASPGTVVCTVTGDVRRAGVGEFRMGTPLRTVIRALGGGPRPGRPVKAVLSGVANPVLVGADLDAAVSYEGMSAVGCGLGSAGFLVFDTGADMVAVAAGVARFLSVESCGQCSPCKLDGIELAETLARLAANRATCADLETVERRVRTVSYGARCYLGTQQEVVLSSILERFRDEFDAHVARRVRPVEPFPVAELVDIVGGEARVDDRHRTKQPDWTHGPTWSGHVPVEIRRGALRR